MSTCDVVSTVQVLLVASVYFSSKSAVSFSYASTV